MKKIKIPNSHIQGLVNSTTYTFPKYTTQIINQANQNAKGTGPNVVGQMSELIREFDGKTLEQWVAWYLEKKPNAIEDATKKVYGMVTLMKEASEKIDEEMVRNWITDLLLQKTFIGLKFQEVIFKYLAETYKTEYRFSSTEEESQGIDGYLGDMPLSIKPKGYEAKILSEEIAVPIVFYEKTKTHLVIEFDETKL
jgi:hypothetical protein